MLAYETKARKNGYSIIAGVDEAGRGPLAGPVVAAAVIFSQEVTIKGLTDSKKLSKKQREKFYPIIIDKAESHGIGIVDSTVIDRINILQATKKAMLQAVRRLNNSPDFLLIDGNQTIDWEGKQQVVVKGDNLSLSIAAASVLAKITRDKIMEQLARYYPQYGFENHKGYGSKSHMEALAKHGPCPIHRITFRGVVEQTENHKTSTSNMAKDFGKQLTLVQSVINSSYK
ncbi:MAG TPA: ribonuclease HII [Nitrospinota bacterium]|nr:ribonuclease HII [Nitrospinota bacterium]|tara:strand:+ start:155666 stop:156352 length:687 start_codon:yes stop_codon:yes gene_type:complete